MNYSHRYVTESGHVSVPYSGGKSLLKVTQKACVERAEQRMLVIPILTYAFPVGW